MTKIICTAIVCVTVLIGFIVWSYQHYMTNALITGHHEAQQTGTTGTIWVEDNAKK